MKLGKRRLSGKEVLSIDIGEHTTKLVTGKLGLNSMTIQHAITIPTPDGSYEKGHITGYESLRNAIQEMIHKKKINTRLAICSVENAEVITREIAVPSVKDEQIEKMLEFEIQQYMPVQLSEYIVQHKSLEFFEEDDVKKTRIQVTAVPRELAQSYYELFKSAGLQSAVMDIQSNAIDKLVSSNFLINGDNSYKQKAVALLDLGYSHINIIVFENGKYKFNRFLNLGTRSIDQNLMNFMDVSMEDAEKLKLQVADLNRELDVAEDAMGSLPSSYADEMRVLNILRNTIDTWVEDIERIFKYYTTRSPGNTIDAIYIYGGVAEMNGLEQYLEDSFGISTSKISSLSNISIGGFSGDGGFSSYINALGTIIRR